MKNKFLIFSLLFLFIVSFYPLDLKESSAEISSSAKAMCVIESSSKRVLFSKNMDAKLPMASTTKIMTAITAIESGVDLDTVFEISP